jgi:hypothetical protein
MATTSYPVYDQFGQGLLNTLGSFWKYYFGDRDVLRDHFRSLGHEQGQLYLDYLHAVASVSRFDTEVFRREDWYLLVLRQSDRDAITNVYGQEELTYGGGQVYGGAQTEEVLFPLPTEEPYFGALAEATYTIYNRVLYPSKTWAAGIDYEIDRERGVIRFREDPFDSDYVAKRSVYDSNGTIVDTEASVWIYGGEFDIELMWERWGFVVAEQLQSSENYKKFVNALWDGYVFGPDSEAFSALASAVLGIPIVLEAREVVEDIVESSTRVLITTDKHSYTFSPNAVPIVSIGDTVLGGEQLVDALRVIDLSSGDRDYSDIPALTFSDSFLSGGYFSTLTFKNTQVDVEYLGVDEDNKAVVIFQLGGFPGDIDSFWERAQTLGKESGKETLAELLDTRANPVGQPLPQYLPVTINPLEFVIENILKNNLTIVKVRANSIGTDAPGLNLFKYLRDIIMPHTTFIVFVEIAADTDTIDLSQVGDDEEAGVEEEITHFGGIAPTAEVLYPLADAPAGSASYEDVVVRVYRVSEVCK